MPVSYCVDNCGFVVEQRFESNYRQDRQDDYNLLTLFYNGLFIENKEIYQANNSIFHRARTNNFTIVWKYKKP